MKEDFEIDMEKSYAYCRDCLHFEVCDMWPSLTCNCENKLPKEEPKQRWIPVSERVPKKERRTYWVCTDAETQHECRWTNNRFGMTELDEWGWSIFDTPQYTKVIAWMPLPEPYKQGGKENER